VATVEHTVAGTSTASPPLTLTRHWGRRHQPVPPTRYDVPQVPRLSPRTWERRYVATALGLDAMSAVAGATLAQWKALGATLTSPVSPWVLSLLLPWLWVGMVALAGGYQRRFLGIGAEEFNRVTLGILSVIALVGTVSWATNTQIARGYMVVALPVAAALTVVCRYALRKFVHRGRARGAFVHRTLVVGHREGIADLVGHLVRRSYHGYEMVGACLLDDGDRSPVADVPVLGGIADVNDLVRQYDIDTVAIVPNADLSGSQVRQLSWDLGPSGTSVLVAPAVVDVIGPRMVVRPVEGLPLLHVDQPSFSGIKRTVKLVYDPVVAGVALMLLAPLLAAIALAIKIDSGGPVFFRQVRVGHMGREFRIVKFRTMVVDAEARKADLAHLNEGSGPLFKLRQDPRVTKVGAFLRKTSLDELPQLLNVVAGQMSIVGPRPHLPSEVEAFGRDFQRRMLVKPGLTGLWQVSGRSDLTFEESVTVDLRYVDNWSLAMDAFILWKTASVLLRGSGAY
jgi:exopolysaccharide biosynthesis polyprenyl glycosylphosphotransferase